MSCKQITMFSHSVFACTNIAYLTRDHVTSLHSSKIKGVLPHSRHIRLHTPSMFTHLMLRLYSKIFFPSKHLQSANNYSFLAAYMWILNRPSYLKRKFKNTRNKGNVLKTHCILLFSVDFSSLWWYAHRACPVVLH